jgi:Ribbon-helix-helix protein, copG family
VAKALSIRLDETTVDALDRATKRLGISKRQFLEEAIRQQASRMTADDTFDVWAETCGVWKRREPPRATIRKARRAFEASMLRHHQRQKPRHLKDSSDSE